MLAVLCLIIGGVVLVAFGYFPKNQSIFYAELMVVYKGLKLTIQLGYYALEVESDLAIMVSKITYHGSVWWDYIYLLGRVGAISLFFLPLSLLGMFLLRLLLQLLSWLIELVLIKFNSDSWFLKVCLLVFLVSFI